MCKRMFFDWKEGLKYLIIVLILPLIPIIAYFFQSSQNRIYFHIILLIAAITLLYDFIHRAMSSCSRNLRIEYIVCCVVFTVIIIASTIFIFALFSSVDNAPPGENAVNSIDIAKLAASEYIIAFLFLIPVSVVSNEVRLSIKKYIDDGDYVIDKENNLIGAEEV